MWLFPKDTQIIIVLMSLPHSIHGSVPIYSSDIPTSKFRVNFLEDYMRKGRQDNGYEK
jgi:hypothetical protein